jgi:hypothetical protein
MIRFGADKRPAMIAMCEGRRLELKDVKLQLAPDVSFVQIELEADGPAKILAGNAKQIEQLEIGGKVVTPR